MPRVFMYGPDTLQERMFDRIGPTDLVGPAVLDGHRLVFNKPNMKNRAEGLPNLTAEQGKRAFGLVFELTRKQVETLEGFFGGYERRDVNVTLLSGETHEVSAFIARRTKSGLKPTKSAVATASRGMEENGAEGVFLEELKSLEVLNG